MPRRIGVPTRGDLEFFGNAAYEQLFNETTAGLAALGVELVEIDLSPFLEAARLLYEGPWVAERYAAIRNFFDHDPDALLPVIREIIGQGKRWLAADAFEAGYRLRALKRHADEQLRGVDCVVTPTAGTIYRIADVETDPIRLNSNLGYYTNFMNLLDLAAVSVPAGFTTEGLPFGVTLFAEAFHEAPLLALAGQLQRSRVSTVGATGLPIPPVSPRSETPPGPKQSRLVVCGAHMSGMLLNTELLNLGARLVTATRTAPGYELFELPGGPPLRPGLIRRPGGDATIEVEVWELPETRLGAFLAQLPAPLTFGTLELIDGSRATGILCEDHATRDARDITAHGSWRAWLASRPG
jgi:allophanate hydrolase